MARLAKLRALGLRQEAGPRIPPGLTVYDPLLPPSPPLVGQEKPKVAADARHAHARRAVAAGWSKRKKSR